MSTKPIAILLTIAAFLLLLTPVDQAQGAFTDVPTSWDNFLPENGGYTVPYTFNGQPVHDEEGSQDRTNGGSAVSPSETDLASGSPDGDNPGPYDTPSYGYYDGGTPYDQDDPSTMEDDYILFTMRLDGDPRSKEGFTNYHWNILLDVDGDGYKEFWIDLYGKYAQQGPDQLQILYDNGNQQNIEPIDPARVEEFSAYNSDTFATSHTRARPATEPSGTTDWFIDIQIPMTAFNDVKGNQVLFPDSPVGFVYSTGASDNNPLQKDFMTDLDFLTTNDPINFGDLVKPNGEPDLYFSNDALDEVDFYTIGEDVYLYLQDPIANRDSNTVQTVTVTVSDPITGDDEVVTLTETGPNTGIFSNRGGIDNLDTSGAETAWIPYVTTSVVANDETWTATYNSATGAWDITGSVSGAQGSATAETEFTSANGAVTFTIYESDTPTDGDKISFDAHAGDRLPSTPSNGVDNDADNDGYIEVVSGDTLSYSYNSSGFGTLTDTAQIVGTGEPYIQFTRATGLPSNNFELVSDDLYVTVYYQPSTNPSDSNYDANYDPAADDNTLTVDLESVDDSGNILTGGDSQTLTLTETAPGSGVFINETGLDTGLAPASPDTPTSEDGTWESSDQGRVKATFTRDDGAAFETTAELFYTAAAGRVHFTNGAGTEDVTQYSPGEPVFVKVTDEAGLGEVTVTVTSDAGDSEDITLYETATNSGIYMNRVNDLVTTAGSNQVSSATVDFTGLNVDDVFVIATGPDAGTYLINSVETDGSITLKNTDGTAFSASESRTGIGFNAGPLMTQTSDGAVSGDGVIEAGDQNSLTVSYTDADDGDNDDTNDVKTDSANYNAPSIVINEVLFYEDTTDVPTDGSVTTKYEYIQLYNSSTSAVNITGYSVTDEDALSYTIPQSGGADVSLAAGEKAYVVLRPDLTGPEPPVYDSASGIWYFYATQAEGAAYDMLSDPDDTDTGDQLTLYANSDTYNTPEAVDFVSWSTTSSNTIDWQSDDFNAVDKGIWTDNDYKDVGTTGDEGFIAKGQVISRTSDGFDSNAPGDWAYASSSLLGEDVGPTYAVISSFKAYADGGRVIVEWRTSAEEGTVGFDLFRKDGKTGPFEQVNTDLLPAMVGSASGGVYYYTDPDTVPGKTYIYKLVETEYDGRQRKYGPFKVTVEGAPDDYYEDPDAGTEDYVRKGQRISEEAKARNAVAKKAREAAKASKRNRSGKGAVKIHLEERGIYYLGAEELAALLNVPTGRMRSLIRKAGLSLTNRGEDVAYHTAERNAGIYFYNPGIDSMYTDVNVFWLSMGDGARMETVSTGRGGTRSNASKATGEETFSRTVHAEVNYSLATGVTFDPEKDLWMWDYVYAGTPLGTKDFNINAPSVAPYSETATLVVRLKGFSKTEADPDHHASISLNGFEIGEGYWDGTDSKTLVLTFDQTLLLEGYNTVQVTGLKDTGAPYSLFFIDSFDLTYQSFYHSQDDYLFFNAGDNSTVGIAGFSDERIIVLDVSDPLKPKWVDAVVEKYSGAYRAIFSPALPDAAYMAMAEMVVDSVGDGAWPDEPSNLADTDNDARYIVISPEELFESSQVLADYRESRGLASMVVKLEDIMDEFNAGVYSPPAIQSFLRHAYYQWNEPPEFVVLVGAGSFDYKGYRGYDDNLMPAMLVGTPHGLYPSDNRYADVVGEDSLPEMAIGRLPVLSNEELLAQIERIIAYEKSYAEGWHNRVLMLSDNADDTGSFPENSNRLARILPPPYLPEKVDLTETRAGIARQQVLEAINGGVGFVHYSGHGSPFQLAREGLLRKRDLKELTNDTMLPVMTFMTCLTGRFDIIGGTSLSEQLVLEHNGGAIAVWSASGMSLDANANVIAEEFFYRAFQGGERTLGLSVRRSLEKYSGLGIAHFMLDIYNLMGDPALRIN